MGAVMAMGMPVKSALKAFRVFVERDGDLYSLTPEGGHWGGARKRYAARGIADATCERELPGQVRHVAPVTGCTCGVYALDSLATLLRAMQAFWFWRLPGHGHLVIAAVLVWGQRGRPVIVGELAGMPGYQLRAPHMLVLALADSPAARRVAERYGLPVLPAAGLEPYAREHGAALPSPAERRPAIVTPRPAPTCPGIGARLIDWAGRWARPRAPRAWTGGLAVALTLVASVHLPVWATWRLLLVTAKILGWLLPRVAHVLLWALLHPIEAVLLAVVAVVLLVVIAVLVLTAYVWTAHLVSGLLPR